MQLAQGNEINDDLTMIARGGAQQQYSSSRSRSSGAPGAGNYNLNDPLWTDM
ncbi:unnamed protein product [Gongylonema pulchrum]|uniref:Single-stranded DNA-binding protein n=1 Tax=Gongylonema pulchrum TaxID=637853 RepID=A0A183EXM8_9BILA|nr:unnamed protein product [Gongylonema pulchrum]